MTAPAIGVVGTGDPDAELEELAHEVGRLLAGAGCTVVCGGLGGVMAAVCRGARSAGGRTVGILPGRSRSAANPWVDVAVATGMGEARNAVIVNTADALVAVGGGWGTLSEIALALRAGKRVAGVRTWDLPRTAGAAAVRAAATPEEAVRYVLAALAERLPVDPS